MRHALVVTYHFPPAGGIPVRRVLRFLRHLPSFGWRCSVLTSDKPFDPYHPDDIEGSKSLPAVERIIRAPAHSTGERVAFWTFQLLAKQLHSQATSKVARGRIRRWIGETVAFPDPKRRWARGALKLAVSLNDLDPYDIIFATGYPWSTLQLATSIGNRVKQPVVLDMRDAWVQNPRKLWSGYRHQELEKRVFGDAATIVTATLGVERAIRNHYATELSVPVTTVRTGYDLSEEPPMDPSLDDPKNLVITYTGTFNDAIPPSAYDQSPYVFLQAIERAKSIFQGKLRVRLVGRIGYGYRAWIRENGLDSIVSIEGPVTHQRALQHQRAADILLVVLGDAPGMQGVLTGKFVEYLGAARPIWAIAPDGELATEVRRVGGWINHPNDVESITERLEQLIENWNTGHLPKPARTSDKFLAKNSTKILSEIFTSLVETTRC